MENEIYPQYMDQEQTDFNISKILNPNNAYKRQQEEILNSIFE